MSVFNEDRSKWDSSSIKTTTLFSFVVFALFLLTVIWGLANFSMDTYYARARSQEVVRTANALTTQFRQSQDDFPAYAIQTAGANGIYIRMDTPDISLIYDGTTVIDSSQFAEDVKLIKAKLADSETYNVSDTILGQSQGGSRFIYATHVMIAGKDNVLYIIAPLHPDPSTIRILRNMLLYISIIVLVASFVLAYMLSLRITKPIDNLTSSATELSKGNYNVKFDGSAFTETR